MFDRMPMPSSSLTQLTGGLVVDTAGLAARYDLDLTIDLQTLMRLPSKPVALTLQIQALSGEA